MTLFRTLAPMGLALALLLPAAVPAAAQQGPLRIQITEGVIEPLPFAVPDFVAETRAPRSSRATWRG